MTETEQSAEVRDAIITASLNGFGRNAGRGAEGSKALAVAGEQLPSNKDVVSAFLKERHVTWMRWFEDEIEARFEANEGGLEIIADVLQEGFDDPKCFGLAFIHIVTEGGIFNREPFAIARMQKEHLGRFIEQLAAKMGLRQPDIAAAAAVLVIEQAIVRTQVTGSLGEAQTARLLLQCLQHA